MLLWQDELFTCVTTDEATHNASNYELRVGVVNKRS